MKYKISEVSKILNIPVDTLRYLETKDIVKPRKNNNNNYRYYEAWDINFLTDFKKFRSFDFTVSEVKDILHNDNLEHFNEKINDRQEYFEQKHNYYTLLMEKNNNYRKSLDEIPKNLWKCSFVQSPELYYFIHRFNYEYEMKDKFEGLFEIWLNYFPFVETIVEMQYDAVMDRQNNNNYEWGFAIKPEYARALKIPINNMVKHIGSVESVYTVISAGDKGSFSLKLLEQSLAFIQEHNYELAGDVIGNLLARVHEESGYCRFIEVWLPVKKK